VISRGIKIWQRRNQVKCRKSFFSLRTSVVATSTVHPLYFWPINMKMKMPQVQV